MSRDKANGSRKINAIKVHQWLKLWDKVKFDRNAHREKPDNSFYMFTLPAAELKALSGIQRRNVKEGQPRTQDLGIQRRHDEERSKDIAEFVQYGYPWSELSEAKRRSGEFDDLRKPGWLPTAIVVNILKKGQVRRGRTVAEKDLMTISSTDDHLASVKLPDKFAGQKWKPTDLHPIQVIDGQHRLWAFEQGLDTQEYELPVVAFYGLDISWEAYLFWTINIKPKRINASLAFDLYPLLRTEDWLEKFEGHTVYRESRAQELVEALWVHPDSPWHQWINMLGESGLRKSMVTQAAWVRALMATYVKPWEGRGVRGIGGLYGAPVGSNKEALSWSRAQQAAFLIFLGHKILSAIEKSAGMWAKSLRNVSPKDKMLEGRDPAFYGQYSLLTTDQGIRGLLNVTNDLLYVSADKLSLEEWRSETEASATDQKVVSALLKTLKNKPVDTFMSKVAESLSEFDWRTSAAPNLTENERTLKTTFRGGSGYKELRRRLLEHVAKKPGDIGNAAKEVMRNIGI